MDHYFQSEKQQRALNTFIKLVRCTNNVTSDVHSHLAPTLTVSQFGILEALYHLGPMSQKELAQKILKSAGNITTIIKNLERDNYVSREPKAEDRRYYNVSLTEKGQKVISELFPRHAEVITSRMSSLSENELQTLGELLLKLSIHHN